MSAGGDVPAELKDAWIRFTTGKDARKLRRHLPALQESLTLIDGLGSSVNEAFGGTRPEAVSQAARSQARTSLVASLQSHSFVLGEMAKVFSSLSAEGKTGVQQVLGWIAERLVKILTAFAGHLGLQSWSVAGGLASLPPGTQFTITLTFS